ncbi:histidine phosphatase family protein [Sphingomonas baiyangensis]|uniref:Histidine phosphatase family protein n=1 Tax=Sphingomonas baiyangensis TaxID=2572576 RepID=A0A4U1L5K8_9SPHN|nr:histidine phosphatase family protein [Sphingomonas baiyangensis]TKD51505.1 histidine phosphatase family protein [Sphingomonas baiyangensis]
MDHQRRAGRDFIARHGETVFNAARRLQGDAPHTPLTRAGFAQAEAMGAGLRALLGARPALTLWASPTGRALQTLAVIAEHLELAWHGVRTDARLREIDVGAWGGRDYAGLAGEVGGFWNAEHGLFAAPPPGGESYGAVATRLAGWLADTAHDSEDRLVVMHGMSSRVLRGLMTGAAPLPAFGTAIAPGLAQGSVSLIDKGSERIVVTGSGSAPA